MPTILLVDDDPGAVGEYKAALETGGFAVETAATTRDARAAISTMHPDVVVMEALLDGGLAGVDLARDLARQDPSLPVVMVTRADEHNAPELIATQDRDGWLPVQRYLQKPVMPSVLLYEVDHLAAEAAHASGAHAGGAYARRATA